MSVLRTIYRYATVVIFVAIIAQIGAAGYGAFYTAGKAEDEGSIFRGHPLAVPPRASMRGTAMVGAISRPSRSSMKSTARKFGR